MTDFPHGQLWGGPCLGTISLGCTVCKLPNSLVYRVTISSTHKFTTKHFFPVDIQNFSSNASCSREFLSHLKSVNDIFVRSYLDNN